MLNISVFNREFAVAEPKIGLSFRLWCVNFDSIFIQFRPLVHIEARHKSIAHSASDCLYNEAQGIAPYSGTGGTFAYQYVAINAKGGKSFICVRSTYVDRDGQAHSNIVPWLPEGSIGTTLKNFVMYVVSEHGAANVYLKTLRDRVRAMVKIAHLDYRQWLKENICTTPIISMDDFDEYILA